MSSEQPTNQPNFDTFKDKAKSQARRATDEVKSSAKHADLEQLFDTLKSLFTTVFTGLGKMADENREKIDSAADRVENLVNDKTDGKYSEKLSKARRAAGSGLDKVVAQKDKQADPQDTAADPQDTAADPAAADEPPYSI